MARKKKQAVEDSGPAGAPNWMVTFSDCMTLLLTFFVLLLSYSSFDDVIIKQLKGGFTKQFPSITDDEERSKDAMVPYEKVRYIEELEEGSERLTFEKTTEGSIKEDDIDNFRDKKVFSWSSSRIFWGKGVRISSEGLVTLKTMAAFFERVAGRIVISENSQQGDEKSEKFGLSRAWEVIKYLAKEGVDKNRFSLSAGTTIIQENRTTEPLQEQDTRDIERKLEIVLLERSVFN